MNKTFEPALVSLSTWPGLTTRVFVDCEYNGPGGALISLAMTTLDYGEFYEVLNTDTLQLNPWVAEHVIPVLGKAPVSEELFLLAAQRYLDNFAFIEFIYNHDSDRRWLDWLLSKMQRVPLHEFSKDGRLNVKHTSQALHNALSDAQALLDAVYGSTQPSPVHGLSERQLITDLTSRGFPYDLRHLDYTVELGPWSLTQRTAGLMERRATVTFTFKPGRVNAQRSVHGALTTIYSIKAYGKQQD